MNAKVVVRMVNAKRSNECSNFAESLEVHARCVRGVYAWLAYDVDLCLECDHKSVVTAPLPLLKHWRKEKRIKQCFLQILTRMVNA